MHVRLPVLAVAAVLATPVLAAEPLTPTSGPKGAPEAGQMRVAKVPQSVVPSSDAPGPTRLHVSTYRVALLPSADPQATFATRASEIGKVLEGGTQADARQRLAALGDVSSVLPKVLVDTSDEGGNRITLGEGTATYVKSMTSGGDHDGEATFGHVRTEDYVTFERFMTEGGPEILFRARSVHVHFDTFSSGGQTVQLPNIDGDETNGPLKLSAKGVVPAVVRDTSAPTGDTAIVYVVSRAD